MCAQNVFVLMSTSSQFNIVIINAHIKSIEKDSFILKNPTKTIANTFLLISQIQLCGSHGIEMYNVVKK